MWRVSRGNLLCLGKQGGTQALCDIFAMCLCAAFGYILGKHQAGAPLAFPSCPAIAGCVTGDKAFKASEPRVAAGG